MDSELSKTAAKTHSVLQANQCFVNRILSRNSSVGRSSHFYYRKPGDVPFKWEVKPGKPKDPPQDDDIVPLSLGPPGPPPAVRSQGLSMPTVDMPRPRSIWLWKKFKKNLKAKKVQAGSRLERGIFVGCDGSEKVNKFELFNSDDDFLASRGGSSSSSSSNRSSISNILALHQRSKLQNLAKGFVRWAF